MKLVAERKVRVKFPLILAALPRPRRVPLGGGKSGWEMFARDFIGAAPPLRFAPS